MGSSKRKERQRLKRKQKQHQLHLAKTSGHARTSGRVRACYITHNWRTSGMAAIFCLREQPDGGLTMASFLVDTWCIGLKDAFGKRNISMREFQENILARSSGPKLVRTDLDVIKRLVAGGIRFARENGFRLPRHYERWTAFLGDLGDIANADLTDFGAPQGGLLYTGPVEDLANRLTDCSVEEFLSRADVNFTMPINPGEMLAEAVVTDDPADAPNPDHREEHLSAIREWCFAQGLTPHPLLPQAWALMSAAIKFVSMLRSRFVRDESPGGPVDHESSELFRHLLHSALATYAPAHRELLADAVEQIRVFSVSQQAELDAFPENHVAKMCSAETG